MASRNLLKYQMGVDRQIPVVLTDSLPALVQTVDVDEVLTDTFSLDYNLDYRILQEQERLALMDMKRKKTEYLPTINAFYNLDFSAQRDEFNFGDSNEDWYRASLVGLSLNLPIFSSGNRRSGVAQKRIALEQARNNREYAGEGLQVQYLQARYDFSNALEKYRSDQKNLEMVVPGCRKESFAYKMPVTEKREGAKQAYGINITYFQNADPVKAYFNGNTMSGKSNFGDFLVKAMIL